MALSVATTSRAQDANPIDWPDDARRTLVVEPAQILGGADDPGGFRDFPQAVLDMEGRFVVTGAELGEIRFYLPDGQYSHSTFVERDGPVAPARIVTLVSTGTDSIWAVTNDGTVHVLDAEGRSHRTLPLAVRGRGISALGDGRWWMSGSVPTPERIGFAFHVVDGAGRIERSFGGNGGRVDPTATGVSAWLLSSVEEGRIWAVPTNRYRLEEWTEGGVRTRILERNPEWFSIPRDGTPNRGPHLDPPDSALRDLYRDREGLLWTVTVVAGLEWIPRDDSEASSTSFTYDDFDWMLDSIVEVLNPESGELIASARIPDIGLGFLGDGQLLVVGRLDDGRFGPRVLQVQVGRNFH